MDGPKKYRVVADNQFDPLFDCLFGDVGSERQTSHDAADFRRRIANQQADIIPLLGQRAWGERFQYSGDVLNR